MYGRLPSQTYQGGRWNQSALYQAYETHLPKEFMLTVAGFSKTQGYYFLPRAMREPPVALQRQLWPWIEEWECRWDQGGLDEDDPAGDGFPKLMRHLRVILLRDLAVLESRFPALPLYSHAPFYGQAWDDFLVSQADEATDPAGHLVQRALPELCDLIETTRSAISHNSQQLAYRLANQQERLTIQLATQLIDCLVLLAPGRLIFVLLMLVALVRKPWSLQPWRREKEQQVPMLPHAPHSRLIGSPRASRASYPLAF